MFHDGDPRMEFMMKELDPRIHFALVCGAKVMEKKVKWNIFTCTCVYIFLLKLVNNINYIT